MRYVSRLLMSMIVLSFLLGSIFFSFLQPAYAQEDPFGECDPDAVEECEQEEYYDPYGESEQEPGPVTPPTQGEVDRDQHGYDDIVGAGDKEAIGLIFVNICSDARPAEGTTDPCECRGKGECSLDDVLQVFVNITTLILGVIGSVILLMFIYGGFLWITSRGEAKRIEKGKDTITHAVIGFAIILFAYSLINFLIAAWAGDTSSEALGGTYEETIDNADE